MSSKCILLTCSCLLLLAQVAIVRGGSYYFSSLGNDASGDGSQGNPWKSITKFNSLNLNPGDQALFRAGDSFAGNLYLDPDDTGNNALGELINPITIGSYGNTGQGRAIISAPTGVGLFSYNNGGIVVKDLEFRGNNSSASNSQGIYFYQDEYAPAVKQESIAVDNVVVDGFGRWGVLMQTDVPTNNGIRGYRDVRVTNSELRNNREGGLSTVASDWTGISYEDVYVGGVLTHDNQGFTGCSPHCGHGIVLGQADGATVEHSVAYDNGKAFGKGNVGIWTWQSNDVRIQHNEAYGNRSPSGGDGGGFDLDGGVTNSVVQYNKSYDNDGAGYLLAQFAYAEPMSQNVFRYNLSVNDGRDNYGAITIWGEASSDRATSAVFHNNTVVVDKAAVPNSGGAVRYIDSHHTQIDLINNIFVATNGAEFIKGSTSSSQTTFAKNAYWTNGAARIFEGLTYPSISAWAQAESQETLSGNFIGLEADPEFANATNFRLKSSSPLWNAAWNTDAAPWPTWITSLGETDFWGTSLPLGSGLELGAMEAIPGDFNYDGVTDGADLWLWQLAFGQGGNADADGDGDSDGRDFLAWQRQVVSAVVPLLGELIVPEPATFNLYVAGYLAMLSRAIGGRLLG